MGVKLKEAVPEKGATQPGPIAAALYQRARHGIPKCAGCGAKLKHVPGYLKHSGSTEVSAHFALRQGHKHASGCKYDIDATLRKIVANSREVRDLGAAALVKHVGSRDQEAVEFRLHVLLVGLEPEWIQGRQEKDAEKAYAYQESKRRLSAYMNCVESIVMVADVVGDDEQLEEKVHVVFNGEKILWRDFFFGFKEHRRLWRTRDKTQGRPITLEFERRDLERNAPAPYLANGHYQISGQFGREEGSPPYNVQVQLQVEDKALADAIWGAKQVVVCSIPRFIAPNFARRLPEGYPPFAHIVLPVRHWSQVFAVGGGGPLKAPPRAADERPTPAQAAQRDAAADMAAPDSRVPVKGMPTSKALSFTDVPPVEDPSPIDTTTARHVPEEDSAAAGSAHEAGVVAGPDTGEKVPSSKQAALEAYAAALVPQTVGAEALSEAEAAGNTEIFNERSPEKEEAVARPDDGTAAPRTSAVAAETPQPKAMECIAPASSAGWIPEQENTQYYPHTAAVTAASLPTTVASDARSRRSPRLMAQAAEALKQRSGKVMERGRSARRRFLAWFGGNG